MNQGRFEQVGTPGEVYEYPANRFIADFVGNINLLGTTVVSSGGGRIQLACEATGGELTAHSDKHSAPGSQCWLAVRPEKIFIDKDPPSADDRTVLKGIVLDLGYFGNLSIYRVQLPTGIVLQVSAQNRRRTAHRTVEWDDEVYVSWDIASAIVLEL
jgi:putrescine transport system ATP-binding protein